MIVKDTVWNESCAEGHLSSRSERFLWKVSLQNAWHFLDITLSRRSQ